MPPEIRALRVRVGPICASKVVRMGRRMPSLPRVVGTQVVAMPQVPAVGNRAQAETRARQKHETSRAAISAVKREPKLAQNSGPTIEAISRLVVNCGSPRAQNHR